MAPEPAGAREEASEHRERRSFAFWLAVVVTAAVAVYAGALHTPWIFDDKWDIVANERVHALWPPAWLAGSRPIVWLSFALNWVVGGADPFGFHLVNVLLHATTAALAFAFVRTTLRLPWAEGWMREEATKIGALAAILWAVHPLHTSAVTYVVHRYEVLASLFYVAALLAFATALGSKRPGRALGASLALVVLAALSKEIAVTLPVAVLLYDRAFGSGSLRGALRARWHFYAPFAAALLAVLCFAAMSTARDAGSSQGFHMTQLSPGAYATSELGVLAHYARLVVWPSGLCIDYYDWPVTRSLSELGPGGIGALLAISGAAWALVRHPRLGAVLAWPLLILAPTSSVLPLAGELAAERRLYLALMAPAAFVALGAAWLSRRQRMLGLLAGGLVAIPLAIATIERNHEFRTAVAIYEANVRVRPGNVRVRYNLANAYKDEGRFGEALEAYRACTQIDPSYPNPYANAVLAARELGLRDPFQGHDPIDPTKDEADAREATALVQAADQLAATGRLDLAIARLRAAIALDPKSADALERLGWVLATADDLTRRRGDEALTLLLRARALRGGTLNLGLGTAVAAALAETGRFDDAYLTASQVAGFAESMGATGPAADLRVQMQRFREHRRYGH